MEFSHVQFGYEPGKPIIHDFSASVKAGQKVAIVGPTGAGKTTMVNLLMRFYEISGGSIAIDAWTPSPCRAGTCTTSSPWCCRIRGCSAHCAREHRLLQPGVTNKQIEDACKAVGLDHFIRSLPDGYDTVLDDKSSLSQGRSSC